MRYKSHPHYVYVVSSEIGLTKIGFSSSLQSRLRAMQMDSPAKLHVFGAVRLSHKHAMEVESLCHKEFAEHRKHGEWFRIDPDTALKCVEKHSIAVTQAAKAKLAERQAREDDLMAFFERQAREQQEKYLEERTSR